MFLNNDGRFMDDLLCGEDQVSDAYTHVDIQMLRERLVFLMDQFELEWREKTCSSSDEAQSKPSENGNAPGLHDFQHQDPNGLVQKDLVETNQETQEPAQLHSAIPESTSGSLTLNAKSEIHAADDILNESLLRVNEKATSYGIHDDGSLGNPEADGAVSPIDSTSENPEMETELGKNSLDREIGLRSGTLHQAIEVGSASVGDTPQWSQKESDKCERNIRTNSDFTYLQVGSFAEHGEDTDVLESKRDELITSNHEFDNERNHEMQENLKISLDTEGFSFNVQDHKEESRSGFQKSQYTEEEPVEALDPSIRPLPISERMAIGYGGNTHHRRECYPESEDLREGCDDIDEQPEDGIDIHGKRQSRNHEEDCPQLRSPPHQSRSSEETLQTVDHTGEKKTYVMVRHRPISENGS
ncbi:hypothetical protein FGB62_13g039 [Gracilaria domingensis]|nr:hypothetical protein FGB62_13g039 [Gracilaria domingensis]